MKSLFEPLIQGIEKTAEKYKLEPLVWFDREDTKQIVLFYGLNSPCSVLLIPNYNSDAISVSIRIPPNSGTLADKDISIYNLSEIIEFIDKNVGTAIAEAVLSE